MVSASNTSATATIRAESRLDSLPPQLEAIAEIQVAPQLGTGERSRPTKTAVMTEVRVKRGKRSGNQKVRLPDGYLDHLDDDTPPCAAAEDATSGG